MSGATTSSRVTRKDEFWAKLAAEDAGVDELVVAVEAHLDSSALRIADLEERLEEANLQVTIAAQELADIIANGAVLYDTYVRLNRDVENVIRWLGPVMYNHPNLREAQIRLKDALK